MLCKWGLDGFQQLYYQTYYLVTGQRGSPGRTSVSPAKIVGATGSAPAKVKHLKAIPTDSKKNRQTNRQTDIYFLY